MEEQNSNSDLLEQETKNFISPDHISALPDSLIHHILSFLPTTKEVIKTSILSNRWRHLWTHVPNLIFYYCKDNQSYGEFIEKTISLHSSSKIKKFFLQLDSPVYCQMNSRIESWIDFAMAREVEELSLEFCVLEDYYVILNYSQSYLLPQFFYRSNSLRKLKTQFCDFVPNDKVDWRLLKLLEVGHAKFTDQRMKNILSGCPSLESLKLYSCHGIHRLDIVSKSLKKLVIDGDLDLSIGQVDSSLEIFAPYLEKLKLLGYWGRKKCRLINVLSLFYVALDFSLDVDHGEPSDLYEKYRKLVMELLEKVCHVKEQKIGTWFIEILSLMEVQSLPSPLSTRKCLILSMSYFEKLAFPGIARLLQSSPKLEKLVVKLCYSASSQNVDYGDDSGENYLTSEKRVFSCLLLHLKRIDIFSFEENLFGNKHALGLVEFLLMNARVLEQMVISDAYPFHVPQKTDHLLRMAKKLLGVPRSSPHAVILFPIPK